MAEESIRIVFGWNAKRKRMRKKNKPKKLQWAIQAHYNTIWKCEFLFWICVIKFNAMQISSLVWLCSFFYVPHFICIWPKSFGFSHRVFVCIRATENNNNNNNNNMKLDWIQLDLYLWLLLLIAREIEEKNIYWNKIDKEQKKR